MATPQQFAYTDPSTWRLKTPGGIPYKLVEMTGSFEENSGSVNVTMLIESDQFINLLEEMFPPPVLLGAISIPKGFALGGAPGLIAQRVGFKSHVGGMPVSPFGADSSAPDLTYFPVLELDVEFAPREKSQEPDEEDPTTFLEISATAGGEFIHAGSSGVELDGEENRNPNLPLIITVPTTEWSVTWPSIDFNYYRTVLQPRLRSALGRVNSTIIPWLYNATPETILFVGYSISQSFTWREDKIDTPPLNVDMKFVEKRIVWNNKIAGHNHFWEPGKGWKKVTIDQGRTVYQAVDLNGLFAITGTVLEDA